MPRPVALLAIALLVALWAGGCGGSSATDSTPTTGGAVERPPDTSGEAPAGAAAKACSSHAEDAAALRATAIPCGQARQVVYSWQRQPSCSLPADASRGSCLTHSYRCQALRSDRGVAVSCARAGESIAFFARRR